MKKIKLSWVLLLLIICTYSLSASGKSESKKLNVQINSLSSSEYYQKITLTSLEIKKNIINENPEKSFFIILPPSYFDNTNRHYPVVYSLQGYNGGPGIFSYRDKIFNSMKEKESEEFIIVDINGANKHGGSFYENSEVTGNWENYIAGEIVSIIDESFRTIDNSMSRGISGFSMGGSGTLFIGLKHPDIFANVYSSSPGLLAPDDLIEAMQTWNLQFRIAYGLVYASDLTGEVPAAQIPRFDGSEKDDLIIRLWENGFGNIREKLSEYNDREVKLNSIFLVYGSYDHYRWIPNGCRYIETGYQPRE